jgi:hypothetical protein
MADDGLETEGDDEEEEQSFDLRSPLSQGRTSSAATATGPGSAAAAEIPLGATPLAWGSTEQTPAIGRSFKKPVVLACFVAVLALLVAAYSVMTAPLNPEELVAKSAISVLAQRKGYALCHAGRPEPPFPFASATTPKLLSGSETPVPPGSLLGSHLETFLRSDRVLFEAVRPVLPTWYAVLPAKQRSVGEEDPWKSLVERVVRRALVDGTEVRVLRSFASKKNVKITQPLPISYLLILFPRLLSACRTT